MKFLVLLASCNRPTFSGYWEKKSSLGKKNADVPSKTCWYLQSNPWINLGSVPPWGGKVWRFEEDRRKALTALSPFRLFLACITIRGEEETLSKFKKPEIKSKWRSSKERLHCRLLQNVKLRRHLGCRTSGRHEVHSKPLHRCFSFVSFWIFDEHMFLC